MIVADASGLFQILGGEGESSEARLFARGEAIFAPYLVDAEIISVLRRHVLACQLPSLAHGRCCAITLTCL